MHPDHHSMHFKVSYYSTMRIVKFFLDRLCCLGRHSRKKSKENDILFTPTRFGDPEQQPKLVEYSARADMVPQWRGDNG